MAILQSPGVSVTVIDESFYTPAAAGTVPLMFVASASDKPNASGTGTAQGTTAANAGKVWTITSQRDLVDTFGTPLFYTDVNSNPIHGGELNEYGLQAAYSLLGVTSKAYVVRADFDLGQLVPQASVPVGAPASGTYWIDTDNTLYGVNEWDATNKVFVNKTLANSGLNIIDNTNVDDVADLTDGVYTPKDSFGKIGTYAIVNTSANTNQLWFKNSDNMWVVVGTNKQTAFGDGWSSDCWQTSWPVVKSTGLNSPTTSNQFYLNEIEVTIGTTDVDNIALAINTVMADYGVGARVVSGKLYLYADASATSDGTTKDGAISLMDKDAGTLASLGFTEGDYPAVTLKIDTHTKVPAYRTGKNPTGSVYVKTTSPNLGANWAVKYFNGATQTWGTTAAPLYPNSPTALVAFDKAGGGRNIDVGKIYIETNYDHGTGLDDTSPKLAEFKAYRRDAKGSTTITSNLGAFTSFPSLGKGVSGFTVTEQGTDYASGTYNLDISAPNIVGGIQAAGTVTFANGSVDSVNVTTIGSGYTTTATAILTSVTTTGTTATFEVVLTNDLTYGLTIKESQVGTTAYSSEINVEFTQGTVEEFAAAVSSAIPSGMNLSVTYNPTAKTFSFSHPAGGDILFKGGTFSPLPLLGFSTYNFTTKTGTKNYYTLPEYELSDYTTIASNWKPLVYEAKKTAPYTTPADGQLWYSSITEDVDILYHNGTTWVGYLTAWPETDPAGPQVKALAPTTQSDGTDLVDNDIWISTADSERYGLDIYLWNTTLGRWIKQDVTDQTTPEGWLFHDARWGLTGQDSEPGSIVDLLTCGYLDPDAPDPTLYPEGMKLWNLRRSGFNVKKYIKNHINIYDNDGLNARYSNDQMDGINPYFADRWVTVSPNNADGSGSFGRHAQRSFVVAGFKSLIDTNQAIRDKDTLVFNLIACPGYPEAIQNMIAFNTDRGQTAFVVGDTPFRLGPTGTELQEWGLNTNDSLDNNDKGAPSYDEYMAMFYPSGYTNDNTGNYIVVPPSHMMLRTIINSDARSYQWFAPAGTRRGGVDNATSVGYLKDGEFQPVRLYEGLRDILAKVKINPIATLPGVGIVNYGNFTRARNASSLDRINVARLVCYLRRQLEILSRPFLFEPNDRITRNEIKAAAESLLLELVGQRALYDFIVVCDESNNTPSRIDRSELWLDIAIEPVKAVEFIYIPLRLKNTGEIKAGT